MSKSEEKLHRIKEEARIKYELTGLLHSKCEKCGILPINMFYLEKNRKGKHSPLKHCKKCIPKVRECFSVTSRRRYNKKARDKRSKRNKEDQEFHKAFRAQENKKNEKARLNLEDVYIKKLLCARGKMKVEDIKPYMIAQKRAEIIAKRAHNENYRKLKAVGINNSRREGHKKARKTLKDWYIRILLRKSGIKDEDMTKEMIEERRNHTQQIRNNIKKNGKYASESQKLSFNYLNKVVNSKTKLPVDQITEEMRQEAKERIIERRSRLGTEPKSAESRVKFQLVKKKINYRKKKEGSDVKEPL